MNFSKLILIILVSLFTKQKIRVRCQIKACINTNGNPNNSNDNDDGGICSINFIIQKQQINMSNAMNFVKSNELEFNPFLSVWKYVKLGKKTDEFFFAKNTGDKGPICTKPGVAEDFKEYEDFNVFVVEQTKTTMGNVGGGSMPTCDLCQDYDYFSKIYFWINTNSDDNKEIVKDNVVNKLFTVYNILADSSCVVTNLTDYVKKKILI